MIRAAVALGCLAFWSAVCFVLIVSARSAPPPGTDLNSPMHEWFERQKNMVGTSCCGMGDGHVLEDDEWGIDPADSDGDGSFNYAVKIGGVWHTVEANRMRTPEGGPNPTGRAVAWWTVMPSGDVVVWCFAPGTEY